MIPILYWRIFVYFCSYLTCSHEHVLEKNIEKMAMEKWYIRRKIATQIQHYMIIWEKKIVKIRIFHQAMQGVLFETQTWPCGQRKLETFSLKKKLKKSNESRVFMINNSKKQLTNMISKPFERKKIVRIRIYHQPGEGAFF